MSPEQPSRIASYKTKSFFSGCGVDLIYCNVQNGGGHFLQSVQARIGGRDLEVRIETGLLFRICTCGHCASCTTALDILGQAPQLSSHLEDWRDQRGQNRTGNAEQQRGFPAQRVSQSAGKRGCA